MKRLLLSSVLLVSCSAIGGNPRGIADKRSDFRKFIPMTGDPAHYGLRAVRPYFNHADRAQILRAIEQSCAGEREGRSVFAPAREAGYYVNCNPSNRQLLNGYVPLNPHEHPHSR